MRVKNATKKGYIEVKVGGCFDLQFPDSENRRGRVQRGGEISPTLDTSCNIGVYMGKVKQTKKLEAERDNPSAYRVYNADGLSPTIDSGGGGVRHPHIELENLEVRRLTPRECFRLQGFPDEYFDRAAEVNSDSQLYKQAGNSVTVNVIYEIARRFG